MKILMPYFKRYRLDVWIAMLSVIVLVFATLWQPRLLQVIIKNDQATVFREGLMLLGLAVLGIIGGIVNTIYAARVALGVATDLRADLYAKVQSLAYADVEKFSPSNLCGTNDERY
ncbi:ABC transporter, ATP-binding and permease protein [Lactiplantibacillus plantarum]|nr:ABC transporter, ATP-binding and permease protein [Lactiplantibacillus plantarum]